MSSAGHHSNGRWDGEGTPPIPSIPLSEDDRTDGATGEKSIGNLVRQATVHMSTLIRAEVELAKQEITAEVKKGLRGSVYFVLALTVLAFSSFFLFFTLAELLAVWLPRWAGFGIVFLVMLVVAGFLTYKGYRRVRSIRKPERTISTVRETAAGFSGHRDRLDGGAPDRTG
ncbi:phage holin family protein [Actinoalloteichus spitiensis]|uniref:phage holin family protein n=1 Tax=Actinoalloteichus spitiensis TaxID=252394 RepID=UPI0003652382|nr:phage holin family protein [Actinoalloteichus spitiensis]